MVTGWPSINWDEHAVNHHIFEAMKQRCAPFDQAVTTLIEDLHERGLDRHVLVVVTGEFGRTPRISTVPDAASGATSPGGPTGQTRRRSS